MLKITFITSETLTHSRIPFDTMLLLGSCDFVVVLEQDDMMTFRVVMLCHHLKHKQMTRICCNLKKQFQQGPKLLATQFID